MAKPALAAVLPLVLFITSCDTHKKAAKPQGPSDVALQRDELSRIDAWAVKVPMQESVELGVIRQRILYDYHFVEGTTRLTPIGRRDARILARHYKGGEWVLNMRQGTASDELYQSRVKAVRILMAGNGVAAEELSVVDGPPGGQGLASTDARRIRQQTIEGAGSLGKGDPYDGGTTLVRPIDTPLEGGF